MSQNIPTRRLSGIPHDGWYAAALTGEVGRAPLARTVLGQRMALWRSLDGSAVALADRCVHAPVALSAGWLDRDEIVAPYTGFRYDRHGECTAVPTQGHPPYGARVHSYPVHDDGSFVWVWPGQPELAALRRTPAAPWLHDAAWTTIGGQWETAASLRLLQDNFADITHVSQVDPAIAPPALGDGPPPPLEVRVSETAVSFSRDYPPAPLPVWQADLMGLPSSRRLAAREEGEFLAPGLWVDRWTVDLGDGEAARFVFTHALTPLSERSTRHVWRVSRDFAPGLVADATVLPLFQSYYQRVRAILEGMQRMLDEDGPAVIDVRVASDAAGSQVRRIMDRLVADETGGL